MSDLFKPDARAFSEATRPHADREAANKAIQEFLDEVAALRRKHAMGNVLVVAEVNVIREEVPEPAIIDMYWGDAFHEASLASYAIGLASERQDELIKDMAAQAKRRIKNR